MADGPAAAPISPAAYARIYADEQPRLVAYARSLTGNPWLADDLVAEAHFKVWRRLSAGHEIENVAAYLTTTVRHLAATAGRGAARETPLDPHGAVESVQVARSAFGSYGDEDPAARASRVDLLTRVLGQLPERWVKALWLAEAEGQPLEAVGRGIGAGSGATAVLLHRAREGLRQAFLRAHPGTPEDPACEAHWDRMPAQVRGVASARQSEKLLAHVDTCDDCRARLAVLLRANDRLPALVGPALLIFVVGGAGKFLLPLAAGAGAAGAGTGAGAGSGGHGSGLLHGVRHVLTGGAKAPAAVAGVLGVSVAGAAVAAGLVLGGSGGAAPVPAQRADAAATGDAPSSAPSAPRGAAPGPSTAPTPPSPAPNEPAPDAPAASQAPDASAAPQTSAAPDTPDAPATAAERAQPVAPEPTQPARPTQPAPSEPSSPAVAPGARTAPAAPPAAPTQPTQQAHPTAPTQPTEPSQPSEPTQPPPPTTPTEPTEPTEPTRPTDPVEPTQPTEPAQPTEPSEPSEPIKPTEPPEPADPTTPTSPRTCTPWIGPIFICRVG
ncbi:sigma factor [Streptomyces sp. NPDC052225]|uniref:sigma factor n=1 Tax=Streptomyces sp. NPDC052225 TaxID=3154949 RepID=UPI003420BE47